jgi:hypothetical protein
VELAKQVLLPPGVKSVDILRLECGSIRIGDDSDRLQVSAARRGPSGGDFFLFGSALGTYRHVEFFCAVGHHAVIRDTANQHASAALVGDCAYLAN